MTQVANKFVVMLLIGASLVACNRERDEDVLANDPLAASSARPEDHFGKGFGRSFRADPKSEPARVADGDVIPVSRTAEPIAVD